MFPTSSQDLGRDGGTDTCGRNACGSLHKAFSSLMHGRGEEAGVGGELWELAWFWDWLRSHNDHIQGGRVADWTWSSG